MGLAANSFSSAEFPLDNPIIPAHLEKELLIKLAQVTRGQYKTSQEMQQKILLSINFSRKLESHIRCLGGTASKRSFSLIRLLLA